MIGYPHACWGKAEQSVRLQSAQFGAAEFQRSAVRFAILVSLD
jgi:hypothetical protein